MFIPWLVVSAEDVSAFSEGGRIDIVHVEPARSAGTGVTVIWYPQRFGTPLYQIWYPRALWEVPHRRARLTITEIWYPRRFGTPPPLPQLSIHIPPAKSCGVQYVKVSNCPLVIPNKVNS